jgi:hypothetical protein
MPSDGPSAAELDRRRRLQWDVIEERAVNTRGTAFAGGAGKPQSSQRNILRRFYATLQRPLTYQTRAMYNPPAPQTLAALRGLTGSSLGGGPGDGGGMVLRYDATGSDSSSAMPSAGMLFGHQLLFTVHYGLGFASLLSEASPRDGNQQQAALGNYGVGGFQLQVRYGNAGGMTTPAFAGGGGGNNNSQQGAHDVAVWNQRFSLPLQDMQSPIELFLIDTDAAARNTDPKDGAYLIGGVMIAPPDVQRHAMDGSIATEQTWKAYRGDHVNFPVTTFERRRSTTDLTQDSAGSAAEGRLDDGEELCLCVSWEVVLASQLQDHADITDCEEEADLFAPVPIQRNGDVKPPAPPRETGSERGSSIPASAAGSSSAAATKYEVEVTFEVERIDRYPSSDTNSKFNPSSALFCMARRCDGECSDYVALRQRSPHAGDGGGYGMYRFDSVEDTGRTCTLTCRIPAPTDVDEALRVIQLLVCETDNTDVDEDHSGANKADVHEGAALRVVASTSLLFTALAPRGSATFVLDLLADDEDGDGEAEEQQQRPYGELCVNWQVTPLQDEQMSWNQAQRLLFPSASSGEECGEAVAASGNDLTPQSIDSDVLCVTIVRGIDLRRAPLGGELAHNNNAVARKLSRPLVAVAVGPLLASTPIATIPEAQLLLHPRAPCNVVWDQELIFPFPSTNVPRRTLVELILQQDHEIISIGALSLQDALERSKVLTNVRGGVVEGFEVVPLLQEGHIGALGHILVRWRYIAHDQLALQVRNRGRSKSTETAANDETAPLENQGHDDVGAAVVVPTATPVKQRLASASPSRTTEALAALRSSPPPTAQPSPRRVSTGSPQLQTPNDSFAGGSSPRRASPGGSLHTSPPPAVMQMSPRRRSVDSCGAPSPIQALQQTENDVAVERGGGLVSPQQYEWSEQVHRNGGEGATSGVERCGDDVAGASEPCDRNDEDREVRPVSSHGPPHSDDDASPNTSVAGPEPRKLVFRVRTGQDGRPQVAFYDPATCSAPASPIRADTTMPQREEAPNGEGVIPPLNGPYHFTRDVSQWSSELHRAAAPPRGGPTATDCVDDADIVKDPAQLLREELEVRNRLGSMKQAPFSRALGKVFPDQPWYPPGESKDELHVPASRRESQRKQLDAIVELTLKSRFVAHQSAARENRGMLSAAVSHDVSRSTSVQQNQLGVMGGLRPHGMHFAN